MGFMALGRLPRTDRKVFRPYFHACEEIQPAYPAPWDFRDRGLRMSKQGMKPLTPELLAAHDFLEPRPEGDDAEDQLRSWQSRRDILRDELEVLHQSVVLAESRAWVVYRPFVYVQADVPGAMRWILLDGQFGTVAAYPEPPEVERIQKRTGRRLQPDRVARQMLRILPSRCPDCGADITGVARHPYHRCRNCQRILRPTPEGLRSVPYAVIDDAGFPIAGGAGLRVGSAYLPFWRCAGLIRHDGRTFADFSEWLRAETGGCTPREAQSPGAPAVWWIPAFESWPYHGYAEWAFEFARWLTAHDPAPEGDNLTFAGFVPDRDEVCDPVADPAMARNLFPEILPFFITDQEQRRLNPLLLSRAPGGETVVERADLVFVAAPLREEGVTGRKVIGPGGRLSWQPLATGQWPSGLRRDTRRKNMVRR
jgi:hypothetical protein